MSLNHLKIIQNSIILLSLLLSTELFALPDINQVINGEVNIAQVGEKAIQVNQNSDKAIVIGVVLTLMLMKRYISNNR